MALKGGRLLKGLITPSPLTSGNWLAQLVFARTASTVLERDDEATKFRYVSRDLATKIFSSVKNR